ncbi:MAG: CoA ester lyase [Sphingomonadales bacterium]
MAMRSLLFVPGDSDRKMEKASSVAADVLILDLEDAVSQERLPVARGMIRDYLKSRPSKARLFVRINPLDTPFALDDLAAIMQGAPDGIFLPKARTGQDVILLGSYLDALEAREGIERGRTQILSVAETAEMLLNYPSFVNTGPRLCGMTPGPEDLAAAVGASTNRDPAGNYLPIHEINRALCLATAASAGIAPIDRLYTDFRDLDGLATACGAGRREGFVGMIAIHPDQVPVMNQAFTPTGAEISHARRVIEAFDSVGGSGVVGLDGKMLDMPHLKQARRVLEMAGEG